MHDLEFHNIIREHAGSLGRSQATTRFATVDGADPATHTVRVRLQPEGLLTGWIPVKTLAAGNGWGVHMLPAPGAQVVVEFQEGGIEAGVVTGVLFSASDVPPEAPAGAWWVVHPEGAKLKFNADGSVDLRTTALRLGDEGGTLRQLMTKAAMDVFNAHTHAGIGSPPSQQMNATDHLTQTVRAV